MKTILLASLIGALLLPTTALAKGGGARAGIEAANKVWMAAVEKGDAAATAATYTTDAQLLPPHHDIVTGQKDIQAFFAGMKQGGMIKSIDLKTSEVFDGGDTAAEVGSYTVAGEKGPLETGKYIVVWKKEGGKWKLHRDAWSSNAPPAAPASAPAK